MKTLASIERVTQVYKPNKGVINIGTHCTHVFKVPFGRKTEKKKINLASSFNRNCQNVVSSFSIDTLV